MIRHWYNPKSQDEIVPLCGKKMVARKDVIRLTPANVNCPACKRLMESNDARS